MKKIILLSVLAVGATFYSAEASFPVTTTQVTLDRVEKKIDDIYKKLDKIINIVESLQNLKPVVYAPPSYSDSVSVQNDVVATNEEKALVPVHDEVVTTDREGVKSSLLSVSPDSSNRSDIEQKKDASLPSETDTGTKASTTGIATDAQVRLTDEDRKRANELIKNLEDSKNRNLVKNTPRQEVNKYIKELADIYGDSYDEWKLEPVTPGVKSEKATDLKEQLSSVTAHFKALQASR